LKVAVQEALSRRRWVRHITGAPTAPVLYEYTELWEWLESVQLQPLVSDRFVWRWTPDGYYSASSAYRFFFVGMSSLLGAKELWKASAPSKVKFFFWLALHGRIWTAERRMRHGLQDTADCALCSQEDETVDHLLLSCVYTRELWSRLLRRFGWERITPLPGASLSPWWMDARRQVPKELRRGFDSTVLLVSWRVWRERNSRVFDNVASTWAEAASKVLEDGDEWIAAGFSALSAFPEAEVAQ
jgi:hypothetical protein